MMCYKEPTKACVYVLECCSIQKLKELIRTKRLKRKSLTDLKELKNQDGAEVFAFPSCPHKNVDTMDIRRHERHLTDFLGNYLIRCKDKDPHFAKMKACNVKWHPFFVF